MTRKTLKVIGLKSHRRIATMLLLLLIAIPASLRAMDIVPMSVPAAAEKQQPATSAADSVALRLPAENTAKGSSVLVGDSLQIADTTLVGDSTLTDMPMSPEQLEKRSDALDAEVQYKSADSLVVLSNGTAFLYGSGEIKYKQMELTSDYIRVKMDSSTLFARGVYDSIDGEWRGRPVFSDGKDKYETNEMSYNLKTQRAFIRHVVTEQGEGYVISERTKKMDDDILMMADGKYTTCNQHDHPHFYLALTKAKVKPGKYIAAGPAYLVVGDVPLPLALPFGFFPFTDTYSSGLIMPTFGDDNTRGLYLRGLGYYFAINDYIDLELTGDIYSRGTWAITAKSKYRWRYKFSGNVSISYRTDVTGEKDMPDYKKVTNMQIQWSHTQDSKANPYSSFSASVNFATSGYNRSNINSYYDPALNSENTKSSSISYTQRFPNSPWSISATASITQRTKDSTLSLTLPTLNVNMASIYPFKRKKALGKEKWYEKIQMRYSLTMQNSVTCKESYLLHSDFLRDWRNGVKHNIPINASFTLFKYLNVSPSINYTERWLFQRIDQSWDDETRKVRRDTTNGFYRVWDLSTSVSMSTKLYGYYIPIRKIFGDKVDRIRHVLTPSLSFTYSPDCDNIRQKLDHNYYASYLKPVVKNNDTIYEEVTYNRFAGGVYSAPSAGNRGTLSFAFDNNIEMKVRNDKDTTGTNPYKVISLIDNLHIGSGYNFMADSMNWQDISLSVRIKLPFRYTLSLSTRFDPYMYGLTASGTPKKINKTYWSNGKFPMFMGTSTSFSYTFNNETFKRWFGKLDERRKGKGGGSTDADTAADLPEGQPAGDMSAGMPDPFAADSNGKSNERNKNERNSNSGSDDGYEKTRFDWSLSVSYTIGVQPGSQFDYEKMRYKYRWTNNLSFSASIGLGKGWKASTTLSYNFTDKRLSYTNINVSRDLHCWSMSASFVPFGPYKSYTFHIGVNASMLSDLKYDTSSTESTNKRVSWW